MPVTSPTFSIAYTGDGVSTAFPTSFYFLLATDLVVSVAGAAKTLGIDYTVAGAHDPLGGGGTVTFIVPPPVGAAVFILRKPPLTQAASVTNNASMLQSFFNDVVDKVTMILQYAFGRSITLQDSDPSGPMQLPTQSARASSLLGFDAAGNPHPYALTLYGIAWWIVSSPPADSMGVAGDMCFDNVHSIMYGPKTTTWGAGTSIVGLKGDPGNPGATGGVGPAGNFNPASGGAVAWANATALPSFTYSAGVITASANGALASTVSDGVTPTVGQRCWIWDYTKANGANVAYGLYNVTQVGDATHPFILTRATDANTAALLGLESAFVNGGAANIGLTLAIALPTASITLGATALPVTVIAGNAARTAADAKIGANLWGEEAYGLLLRMTNPAKYGASTAIANYIAALKTANLYAKLDCLQVYVAQDTQAGTLNWIANLANATLISAPAFVPYRGFSGDGVASYIDTGFNLSTSPVNASLNSATMLAWSNTPAPGYAPYVYVAVGTNQSLLGPAGTAQLYGDLNRSNAGAALAAYVGSQIGLVGVTRVDASNVRLYQNGGLLGNVASASTAAPAGNALIDARNFGYTVNGFQTAQISLFAYGAAFSDADHVAFYNATRAFMAALGNFSTPVAGWGDSLTQNVGQTPWLTQMMPLRSPQRNTFNQGISGQTSAQIAARMLADTSHYQQDIAVIWAGRNDPGASITQAQTLANIASMVAHQANGKFVVLSVPNGNTEPSGNTQYNNIIALNTALQEAYPFNYIDIRAALVAAYNPSLPQDAIDHGNDVPPSSLRADFLHPNTAGCAVIAPIIDTFIQNKGW